MREELIAGDSIDEEVEAFDSAGNEYSGDDGWAAKFVFVPRAAGVGTKFEMPCSWGGDAFRYQVSAATSAAWVPADYSWTLLVSKTGLRVVIQQGAAIVLPNPETAASHDVRSQAEVALADSKLALATFNATGGRVKSYSIAGRSMEFETADGIQSTIGFWTNEVLQERRARARAAGQPDPFMVYARI
jgi:hypothetical protein